MIYMREKYKNEKQCLYIGVDEIIDYTELSQNVNKYCYRGINFIRY